jgi:hypothetical protein
MSNVVNIAYRADIKNLQAELARIPGITRTEAPAALAICTKRVWPKYVQGLMGAR